MHALVVGGGVVGLTTAVVLREQGHEVTVAARAWAPDTVSAVAAAIWHPFQVAHPESARLAAVSARRFYALARRGDAGVRVVEGWDLFRARTARPAWADAAENFRELREDEIPEGYAAGMRYDMPLIETPVYLRWLLGEVERLGARRETRAVESLAAEAGTGRWEAIVNCTGLDARELVPDPAMVPIRGQIVKLPPGLASRTVLDEDARDALLYVIPRSDATILGGTAIAGDWDLAVREETTREIVARAAKLIPGAARAPVLEALVGLRPGRHVVRLEREEVAGIPVVHNYGHGGSGFTLSWGCAEDAARLAL